MIELDEIEERKARMRNFSIALLSITSLVALIFIPVLMKALTGTRKLYIILQQICTSIQLTMLLMSFTLISKNTVQDVLDFDLNGIKDEVLLSEATKTDSIDIVFFFRILHATLSDLSDPSEQWTGLSMPQLNILLKVATLFRYFANNMFYFLSLMQSLDIYVMVCKPMAYTDFVQKRNVMKNLFIGTVISFLLASEKIMDLLFTLYYQYGGYHHDRFLLHKNMHFAIHLFILVAFIIAKIIYSLAVVRLAFFTRAGLLESSRMSKKKGNLHKKLFLFTLIPMILCMLFTVHEVLTLANEIKPINSVIFSEQVREGLSSFMLTVGSCAYYFIYLILFSQVRDVFMCKSKE